MLRTTPFHSRTAPLCQAQNWRRWAGYVVAGSYELLHDREYWAIRSAAALLDVSPLYKYLVRGRDAARLLDRVVTRAIGKCAVGQVMYTPWCDDAGKVLDDGTVTRLDEDAFRLTAAEPNLRWLHENRVGLNAEIEDVSDATAALAVQGPAARDVLRAALDANLDHVRFFRATNGRVDDVSLTITRTGYTGDLGYELWFDARHAERIWDHLMTRGLPYGLTPAGILALDVARIEAGLILLDVDYVPARKALIEARTSSPFELGLGWTVRLDKDYFVGQRVLRAEQAHPSAWQLRGLEIDWDGLERLYAEVGLPVELPATAWRTSVPVYAGGEQVGYATSGCWSPLLKRYIALAHLKAPHTAPGSGLDMEVTVEHRRRRAPARVRALPFFNPERKRA
ncbi:MAG TPA: aminomethyltransferase family protein [Gemmatimonadales bacterium]|nr:aminomethyltransferase family protein [Gemmatimonadales bacterium]